VEIEVGSRELHDLQSRVARVLRSDPDATAIVFEGRDWPRAAFRDFAEKLEQLLYSLLPEINVPVGIAIRNRPTHLGAFWGLIAAGRPAAFVNPFQDSGRIAEEVTRRRLAVLIADEEDWASIALQEAARAVGTIGIVIGRDVRRYAELVPGLSVPGHAGQRDPLPGVAVEMLTSGTSGAPKLIPLRYDALGFAIYVRQAELSRLMGEAPAHHLPAAMLMQYGPVVHLGGLFTALQAAMEGRPLVLFEKFEVESWRQAIRKYRPRMIGLPPAQMRMVLDAGVPAEDLSGVVGVRCGNAMLDDETRKAFEQRYGIPVLIIYGATEYYGPVASWTLEDHRRYRETKRDSVGRVWPQISRVRVVDPETRLEREIGETGILEVRIPTVGDAWITTNDLAALDADQFLYLKGRADDAINRGGFKILPMIVEAALRKHPAVADVMVVGIPDLRLGSVPAAAVEHRIGTPRPTAESLYAFARQHLIAYQVPVQIRVLDALPRTPGLKVSRQDVMKLFNPV